ncbi:hypothetical protein GCM10022285_37160 [Streptomyces tunisiensis]|uniref:Uncharacterized protein n=1 Tax=Streptomyces tunisiensis TaxID=948699 RepID=A0ABP7YRA3_9ACTN
MPVEGSLLQPLDGADEEQFLGDGSTVGPHEIDLDVIGTGPVTAHHASRGQPAVGEHPRQGFPDQGFDGPPPPAGPVLPDAGQGQVAASPLDLVHGRAEQMQPEPQIGIGHPIAAVLRGAQCHRQLPGDDPLSRY